MEVAASFKWVIWRWIIFIYFWGFLLKNIENWNVISGFFWIKTSFLLGSKLFFQNIYVEITEFICSFQRTEKASRAHSVLITILIWNYYFISLLPYYYPYYHQRMVCYIIKEGLLSYNGEFVFIKGEFVFIKGDFIIFMA